jgi:hypothetical protein
MAEDRHTRELAAVHPNPGNGPMDVHVLTAAEPVKGPSRTSTLEETLKALEAAANWLNNDGDWTLQLRLYTDRWLDHLLDLDLRNATTP